VSPAGAITWTPTEAQGPVLSVQVKVTDRGTPPRRNQRLHLWVNEVNVAGAEVPGDQTINELVAFNPPHRDGRRSAGQHADFALVNGPPGLTVSPAGAMPGPPQAQGQAHIGAGQVTDNGTPALSVTSSFTLTVNEVNVAPVLTVPEANY
jgi:hypothetical protein